MLVSAIIAEKGGSIISVAGDRPLIECTQILREHRIGAVLVMDHDQLSGVLSERDIIRGLSNEGADILSEPASTLMTRKVITCSPDVDLLGALELMTDNRIRHLPVLDGGKLLGVISIGDLVSYRIKESELEAEALKGYIAAG
ncbi:MAG: CBS domain-containing protein [Pseudomonadota bacterium]